jgi:O-antigen/teichoic acid export membrane protein
LKSLVKRIALNAGTLVSGGVTSSAIGLVSFSLLARELGTELFGVLALVQVYAVIIDGLINFQSWQALIKYGTSFQLAGQRQELGKLYSFGFLVDAFTALLATLVGVTIPLLGLGEILGWDSLKATMASIFALGIIFNIEGTPTAIFRMHDRYRVFVVKSISAATLRLILIILGIYLDQSIWYFFYAILVSQILSYLYFTLTAIAFLRKLNIPLSWPKMSLKEIRRNYPGILTFITTTNLHGTVRMMTLRLDTIIIDTYLGSAATGLYQVAKQFARVFTQVSQPLYKVIYPELTKLWEQGRKTEFILVVRRFCAFASFFGVIVWTTFYLFPEYIIFYTVGPEFNDSIPILTTYLIGVVLSVSNFPITPAILAMGYPNISFRVQLVSSVIYFIALFLLLKYFGVVGAGMAYAILYFSWILIMTATYHMIIKKNK